MLTIEATLRLSINVRFILSNNGFTYKYFNILPLMRNATKLKHCTKLIPILQQIANYNILNTYETNISNYININMNEFCNTRYLVMYIKENTKNYIL